MEENFSSANVQSELERAQQNKAFFSADLDPAELQQILARIEENLAFRQVLRNQVAEPRLDGTFTLPLLPATYDIDIRLQRLRSSQAPLFVPAGGGWGALVRRILNMPIRLFGYKQINFNRELLELVSQMALLFHVILERQQDTEEWLRSVAERQQRLEESIAKRQQDTEEWLRSVAERQQGTEEWIRLIQTDVRDIAFEVREIKGEPRRPLGLGVWSAAAHRPQLTGLREGLKVNVGCGHRPMEGYVNVDFRELPEADVVAAARYLPFPAGSIEELRAAHLIEHFREYEFKTRVLPHWRTRLKPSGVLRVICPNWEAMMRRLQAGEMTFARFKEITFGGQEYEGNDHFSMYTPESLTALLRENGFPQVEVVVTERDNGGCPEMELVAIRH